jgi:hypothetical protein
MGMADTVGGRRPDSEVFNNDKDGDGIPDDYDKDLGETVAEVAARVNGVGKYARRRRHICLPKAQPTMRRFPSALNEILAGAGAASTLLSWCSRGLKHGRQRHRRETDRDKIKGSETFVVDPLDNDTRKRRR